MSDVDRRLRLLFAPSALALAVVVACRGPSPAPPGDAERDYEAVGLEAVQAAEPAVAAETVVARAAVRRVPAFRHPGDAHPFVSFGRQGRFGERRVFLVRGRRDDWLHVLLPMRPNGADGWIRARHVDLAPDPYRVEVDLSRRRLIVFEDDRSIMRERVAVGMPDAPTPTGLFFTTVLARPDDPTGPYGRFAYGLSAYSEVYREFAGGDGQVAIHGTNAPWLIGQAVSHGCIRMRNEAIARLADFLPVGTPVRVTH
jgi:lipoprotein-anchoring transpeptidase ErfK/SrfK